MRDKYSLPQSGTSSALWMLMGSIVVLAFGPPARAASPPVPRPLGSLLEAAKSPARVATDSAGRIYVTDARAGSLTVFDAFGRIIRTKDGFGGPLGIAVDAQGNVYVGEEQRGRVGIYNASLNLVGQLGQGDGEFLMPNHIAIDAVSSSNTVYVSDSAAHAIKAYQNGVLVKSFGSKGAGSGQFDFPAGLLVSPANEVLVVDQNNDRVQVFDLAGVFKRSFILGPPGSFGPSGRGQGIARDDQGRIYVADAFQCNVKVFDAQGVSLSTIGQFGQGEGDFHTPAGLAIDGQSRLLVASANNARVDIVGLDCFTQLAATPASQSVAPGGTVTFSVSAGCPDTFTYQWRKDSNNLTDGGTVSGATTATLTIAGVGDADAGQYSVVITGPSGPVTTPAAELVVVGFPMILSQPSNVNVIQGQTATFSVTATGGMLEYQWMFNGLPIPGANESVLTITNVLPANAGDYAVWVSNVSGSVNSMVARLSVVELAVFTLQPASQTVAERGNANFVVQATGTAPLNYQWYFQNNLMIGQNTSQLSLSQVTPANAGNYHVVISNPAGLSTSAVATLTVIPDTTAPRLLTADGGALDSTSVRVTFSKPLAAASAQNGANYQVLGAGNLTVLNAALSQQTNVVLTLSGVRTPNANYELRVQNVTDDAYTPNPISPNPTTIPISAQIELVTLNTHSWKYYQTTSPQGLDAVPWKEAGYDDSAWPAGYGIFYGNRSNSVYQPNPNPNVVLPLTLVAGDPNSAANTILNVFTNSGNVVQEVTYYFRTTFYFPAETNGAALLLHHMIDDGAVVYLNGQRVFDYNLPTDPALASTYASGNGGQTFVPALTSEGQSIVLTGLKSGRNTLAVEVHQVNNTSSDITFGLRLQAKVVAFASGPLSITAQPQSLTVFEGQSVTLRVTAEGGLPIAYQWHRNGAPIVGATNASYTIASAVLANEGDYHVVITNPQGSVESAHAQLTVIGETTPPTIVSAYGGTLDSMSVLVTFNKNVELSSAQNAANYEVLGPGNLTVWNAAVSQGTNVTLIISGPRQPNEDYLLRVKDVRDTAGTPNTLSPNPTTVPIASLIELISIAQHSWKYYQTSDPQGLDQQPWTETGFDDSGWPGGSGVFYGNRSNSVYQPNPNPNIVLPLSLDAGDPFNSRANTILNVFTNAGNVVQEVTYYFRTTFNFPAETNGAKLLLHRMIDDGAVFYLNGQRIHQYNLSTDPVHAADLAEATGGQSFVPASYLRGQDILMTGLRRGANVLAVEVHQQSLTSDDITMGLRLSADVVTYQAASPKLAIGQPAGGNLTITWDVTGYVLEFTDDLNQGWTSDQSAASPLVLTPQEMQGLPSRFYRLRKLP